MSQPAANPTARSESWRAILAPRRGRLLAIAAAILAGAGLELVPPLVLKHVIDAHLAVGVAAGLGALAVLYLGAVVGAQTVSFLTNYLTALTAQHTISDLRVRLFAHLQRLPLSYYDRTPLGEIISRCTADVDTLDALFSSGVAGLVADLVRLVAILGAMVSLSPRLALLAALVAPPLVGVTSRFRRRIREAERRNRIAIGALNTRLHEALGGIETIRAFGREPDFVQRFRGVLRETLQAFNETAWYSSLYSPIMQSLMAVVIALLLWTGARPAFSSLGITLGTLTAFVLLFRRFFDPITSLGEDWQTVQSALSGVERIFQVLNLEAETQPSPGTPGADGQASGSIAVRHVTFGYASGQAILRDVSLAVAPGEHVALVGRTGAGKSTLLHMLGGLYAPWEGDVLVAGSDPRQLSDQDRRRVIGVVPQQVQLFSGSILENLTLGDPLATLEQVVLATRIAGIEGLVRALPQGYHTQLGCGRDGVQLSAGQHQLLSLARALVWNPSVLLFDEATSAIDSASEAAFRAALAEETRTRKHAVLTVAHRLATARAADRVVVLAGGRVVEAGTPAALIRQGGRFAALLELEAAGWDWQDIDA